MTRPPDPRSESRILADVLTALKSHPAGDWAARINVGGARHADGRLVRYGFPGLSDIIGQMADGRFLACEVKSARGRLTGPQSAFLARVGRQGVSILARSVADVYAALGEPGSLTAIAADDRRTAARPGRRRTRWQSIPIRVKYHD